MIDNTNPKQLENEAISQEIARLQSTGDLQMDDWTKGSMPATGWTVEAYAKALDTRRAPIPQFPGAAPRAMGSGGWLDQVRDILGNEEGSEGRAYHGATSSLRKAGKKYIEENDPLNEETAIGYGWDLRRKDTDQVFYSQLGYSPSDIKALKSGQMTMPEDKRQKLRDYAIMEMNGQLERDTKDVPLRDHQRAALVSLAYNMGYAGLKKTGIVDAVKAGKPDAEVAKMIMGSNSISGMLNGRRRNEAALYLGAQATAFFASPGNPKTHN